MSKGEKAVLEIQPEYGYGSAGAGGVIPGGATLVSVCGGWGWEECP